MNTHKHTSNLGLALQHIREISESSFVSGDHVHICTSILQYLPEPVTVFGFLIVLECTANRLNTKEFNFQFNTAIFMRHLRARTLKMKF